MISLLTGAISSGNTLTGVTLSSSGILTWPESSASGVYHVDYQICEVANIYNCSTAQAHVAIARLPRPIQANADSGTFLNTHTGTLSLLDNDTFSGSQAHTGVIHISLTGASTLSGVSLDSEGDLIIPPSSLTGVFLLSYEICEITSPTNCSSTEITLTLEAPIPATIIQAYADSGTFFVGNTAMLDVLYNDTLSGSVILTGAVVLAFTGENMITGSTLDTNGILTIPATTLTGVYILSYEICESINLTNCSTAEITITIASFFPALIYANADSGTFLNTHTGNLSLLDNDTFSGSQAHTGVVTFGFTGDTLLSNPLPDSYINPDGLFITPPTSLTGTFTLFYEICEITSPINCSTAQIAITIESTPIIFALLEAHDDVARFLNTMTGTIDILQNDLFSGSHATLTDTFVSLT